MYKKCALNMSVNLLKLGLASYVRNRSPFCTLDQVPGRSRRTSRRGRGHISERRVDINRVHMYFNLSSNQDLLNQHFTREDATWMAKMSAMATKDF